MAQSSQDRDQNHGRLSQDQMEQMIIEMHGWMQHMQRVNPQFVMPHPTEPAIDSEGRANLNRAPAATDTRRRD